MPCSGGRESEREETVGYSSKELNTRLGVCNRRMAHFIITSLCVTIMMILGFYPCYKVEFYLNCIIRQGIR